MLISNPMVETADIAQPQGDYVLDFCVSVLQAIAGGKGDIVVLLCIVGIILMLWKKRFRSAVGFLFLIASLVFVRVLIQLLFGSELKQ